jgi:hypothetical protein
MRRLHTAARQAGEGEEVVAGFLQAVGDGGAEGLDTALSSPTSLQIKPGIPEKVPERREEIKTRSRTTCIGKQRLKSGGSFGR